MNNKKISLVTAAYNEESTIGELIDRCKPYVDEIIVSDDGSTDRTEEIVLEKGAVFLKHTENQGQEKRVDEAIRAATGDIIITIDSDLEHIPEDIPMLLEELENENVDMVIGSRSFLPRESERAVAKFTKPLGIDDPFCSFRAFKRHVFDTLGFFYKHNYYGVDFNLSAAKQFNVKNVMITEAPVRTDARIGDMETINKKLFEILEYLKKTY